ncbi:hypothetical protein YB2330_004514 [Saitoella coloradoensis]
MADKLRVQSQLELLQSRYIGTGHADTTKHQWMVNQHRDSLSSFVGHAPMLEYMSVGLGETMERTRLNMIEKMVQPCGPPPPRDDD